ncbi:MAG: guanylate kinase [Bacteroidales bacterium]|nr:guanylate kinase [Bacteroidales bacterium]
MKGKAIIFSAPSGSGKTTIVKHLLQQEMNLEFSVSACSRELRENEVNGKDYYFLSVEKFKAGIEKGDFIEWEEVYKNHYYGTLKSELERIWNAGRQVIFDVDVVGGKNLKNAFGNDALAVFVQPPSIEVLEQRLRDRSTDPEEKIMDRIAKASQEMKYADQFDVIIINDRLDDALAKAEKIVSEFLSSP